MASITINPIPNQGISSISLTGGEKLVAIDSNGKPVTVGVNQILNKVDDRIDDIIDTEIETQIENKIDDQFDEILDTKIDDVIDDKLDDVLDDVGNLNWNDVS